MNGKENANGAKKKQSKIKNSSKNVKKSPSKSRIRSPNKTKKSFDSENEGNLKQKTLDDYFTPPKKSGNVTLNKSHNIKKDLRSLSPSVLYDCVVPKIQDILRDEEKYKRNQALYDHISELEKRLEFVMDEMDKIDCNDDESLLETKDCKHLTFTELNSMFKLYNEYLDDLFYGRITTERSERFKNSLPQTEATNDIINDLMLSETNLIFSHEQLMYIIDLFRKRYDNGNIFKYTDYYFKVLLHEFGLKIYCDQYDMTEKEAVNYIKKMPVSLQLTNLIEK